MGSIIVIVGGEGEEALKTILDEAIKEGVFLNNHIDNLDELPIPDYEAAGIEKYFEFEKLFGVRERPNYPGSERTVSFISSRGCPYSCSFCTVHNLVGKKWRPFSVDYVIGHMKHLINRYSVKHFHFEDDNLTLDLKRSKELFGKMKGPGITFDTPNGVRVDSLDEEALELCKECGCFYLIIGVESASQDTLDKIIRKSLDLKKVMRNVKLAYKHKLRLKAFFIIGFPGETRKDIDHTMDFALSLYKNYNVEPEMSIVHPYVGTRIYAEAKEKGFLVKSINEGHVDMIKTDEFDEQYLESRFSEFRERLNSLKK